MDQSEVDKINHTNLIDAYKLLRDRWTNSTDEFKESDSGQRLKEKMIKFYNEIKEGECKSTNEHT